MESLIKAMYPRVCTCKEDIILLQTQTGASYDVAEIYTTCSESPESLETA